MRTEVWLRNPRNWIVEAVECRASNIIFSMGTVIKWNMDPVRFMELFYPADLPWRLVVVGDNSADEFRSGSPDMVAQWPVWNHFDAWPELLDMIEEQEERDAPEKRVILANLPDVRTGPGAQFMITLAELQAEHPDVILHLHGLNAFVKLFSHEYGAVDLELRTSAAHKRVFLPNGKMIHIDYAAQNLQWINMLGYSTPDLQVPRNRCMYNIKAALWAGDHFRDNERFLSRRPRVEYGSGNPQKPAKPKRITPYSGRPEHGDKFLCNLCSLQSNCQFFREGSVCGVPDSEPTELANFFKSRDSDTIITGLQTLLQFQARRVEREAAQEDSTGEYSKELTKLVDSLFDRGIKLAKLVDPKLSSPKLAVLLPGGAAPMPGVANQDPREMVKQVIIELEGRGIPRDKITPEMLTNILGAQNPQQAIQAAAITA